MKALSVNHVVVLLEQVKLFHDFDETLYVEWSELSNANQAGESLTSQEQFVSMTKKVASGILSPYELESWRVYAAAAVAYSTQGGIGYWGGNGYKACRSVLKSALQSEFIRQDSLFFLPYAAYLERFLLRRQERIYLEAEDNFASYDKKLLIAEPIASLVNFGLTLTAEELVEAEEGNYRRVLHNYQKYLQSQFRHYKKELIQELNSYIIRFLFWPEAPHRNQVDQIVVFLAEGEKELIQAQMMKRLRRRSLPYAATLLYKELVNSIKSGNLSHFVIFLSLYTRLTKDRFDVPFKKEVEALEKKVYPIIDSKGLWSRISL